MPSLTLTDMASRTGAMAEPKRKKNWIKKAINPAHKGVLRNAAKREGETTKEFAAEHAGDTGKMGKRARLAETLMHMSHKKRKSPLYEK